MNGTTAQAHGKKMKWNVIAIQIAYIKIAGSLYKTRTGDGGLVGDVRRGGVGVLRVARIVRGIGGQRGQSPGHCLYVQVQIRHSSSGIVPAILLRLRRLAPARRGDFAASRERSTGTRAAPAEVEELLSGAGGGRAGGRRKDEGDDGTRS